MPITNRIKNDQFEKSTNTLPKEEKPRTSTVAPATSLPQVDAGHKSSVPKDAIYSNPLNNALDTMAAPQQKQKDANKPSGLSRWEMNSVDYRMPNIDAGTTLTGLSATDAYHRLYSRAFMFANSATDQERDVNRQAFRSMWDEMQIGQDSPSSVFYNPYRKPTTKAYAAFAEMGIDATQLSTADLLAMVENGRYTTTGTTPAAPTTSSTPEQNQAYWAYQILNNQERTKRAVDELADVQRAVDYYVQQGLSDSEITSRIQAAYDKGTYSTLRTMDNDRTTGGYTQLNEAVDWMGMDSVQGMIWSARNGGQSLGSSIMNAGAARYGLGTRYRADAEAEAMRDRSNTETYHPYAQGTTLEDEALQFGVSSFDSNWLAENRSMLNGTDSERKTYQKIQKAVETADAAQEELTALNEWVQGQIDKGKSWEQIEEMMDKDTFWKDYATLQKMENKRSSGDALEMGYAVDFSLPRWKAQIEQSMAQPEETPMPTMAEITADPRAATNLHNDIKRYFQGREMRTAYGEQFMEKFGALFPVYGSDNDMGGTQDVRGIEGGFKKTDVLGYKARELLGAAEQAAADDLLSADDLAEYYVRMASAMEAAENAGMTLTAWINEGHAPEVSGITSVIDERRRLTDEDRAAAQKSYNRAMGNELGTAYDAVMNGTATDDQVATFGLLRERAGSQSSGSVMYDTQMANDAYDYLLNKYNLAYGDEGAAFQDADSLLTVSRAIAGRAYEMEEKAHWISNAMGISLDEYYELFPGERMDQADLLESAANDYFQQWTTVGKDLLTEANFAESGQFGPMAPTASREDVMADLVSGAEAMEADTNERRGQYEEEDEDGEPSGVGKWNALKWGVARGVDSAFSSQAAALVYYAQGTSDAENTAALRQRFNNDPQLYREAVSQYLADSRFSDPEQAAYVQWMLDNYEGDIFNLGALGHTQELENYIYSAQKRLAESQQIIDENGTPVERAIYNTGTNVVSNSIYMAESGVLTALGTPGFLATTAVYGMPEAAEMGKYFEDFGMESGTAKVASLFWGAAVGKLEQIQMEKYLPNLSQGWSAFTKTGLGKMGEKHLPGLMKWLGSVPGNMLEEGAQELTEYAVGNLYQGFMEGSYKAFMEGDTSTLASMLQSDANAILQGVSTGFGNLDAREAWESFKGGAIMSVFLGIEGAAMDAGYQAVVQRIAKTNPDSPVAQAEAARSEVMKDPEHATFEQIQKAALLQAEAMQDPEYLEALNQAAESAITAESVVDQISAGALTDVLTGKEATAREEAKTALDRATQERDRDAAEVQKFTEALTALTQQFQQADAITDEMVQQQRDTSAQLEQAAQKAEASSQAYDAASTAYQQADTEYGAIIRQRLAEMRQKAQADRQAQNAEQEARAQARVPSSSFTSRAAIAESRAAISGTTLDKARARQARAAADMATFTDEVNNGRMSPGVLRTQSSRFAALRTELEAANEEVQKEETADVNRRYPAQARLAEDIEAMRTHEYGSQEYKTARLDAEIAGRETEAIRAERAVEEARAQMDASNPESVQAFDQAQANLEEATAKRVEITRQFAEAAKKQMVEQLRESGQERVATALESRNAEEISNFLRDAARNGKFDLVSAAEAAGVNWNSVDPLTREQMDKLQALRKGKYGLTDTTTQRTRDPKITTQKRILDALGKKYGFEVVLTDSLEGRYNGSYMGGRTLYVAADAVEGALVQAGMHEAVHMVANLNHDGYQGIVQAVRQALGPDFAWDARVMAEMEGKGMTQDEAIEEIVAESVPSILTSPRMLQELGEEQRGLFQKIYDRLKEFWQDLKNIASRYSEAQGRPEIDAMLKAGEDMLEQVRKAFDAAAYQMDENAMPANQETGAKHSEIMEPIRQKRIQMQASENVNMEQFERGNQAVHELFERAHDIDAIYDPSQKVASTFVNGGVKVTDKQLKDAISTSGGAGPLRTNIEYIFTFDVDTNCPKTIRFDHLLAALSQEIGRGLNETEARNLMNLMRYLGDDIPCSYCYMNNKRLIKSSYFNAFLERYADIMSLPEDQQVDALRKYWTKDAEQKGAVRNLENWRSMRQQYTPAEGMDILQSMRTDTLSLVNMSNDALDAAFPRTVKKGIFNKPSRTEMLRTLSGVFGTDLVAMQKRKTALSNRKKNLTEELLQIAADQAGIPVSELSKEAKKAIRDSVKQQVDAEEALGNTEFAELTFADRLIEAWCSDVMGDRKHARDIADDEMATPDRIRQNIAAITSLYALANNYSSSVSQARNIQNYEPYSGHVWNIDLATKHNINSHDGFRVHSSNDFRIEFLPEYIQFFADLAADKRGGTGWKAHAYAKQIAFAYIFWKTGAAINLSVAYNGDRHSGITANSQEGVNPADIQEFYRRNPEAYNVGVMAMVTNDDQLGLAMADDNVHMIIPYHASGLESKFYHNVQRWLDYTQSQNETWIHSDKRADNAIYRKDSKGNLVRVTPHFLPGDQVGFFDADGNSVTLPGHGNDVARYKELCAQYGVHPRFYDVQVPEVIIHKDGTHEFTGKTIAATEHSGYLKLIKEGAMAGRTDANGNPVVQREITADFDLDYALELAKLGPTKYEADEGGQDHLLLQAATGFYSDSGNSLIGEDRLLITPEQEEDMRRSGEEFDPNVYMRISELFDEGDVSPEHRAAYEKATQTLAERGVKEQAQEEMFRQVYRGLSQNGAPTIRRASQIESAVDQQLGDAIRRGDNYEFMRYMGQQDFSGMDEISQGLEAQDRAYADQMVQSGEWAAQSPELETDLKTDGTELETGSNPGAVQGQVVNGQSAPNPVRRTPNRLQRAMGVHPSMQSHTVVRNAEQTAMARDRATNESIQAPVRTAKDLARKLGVPLHRNLRQRGRQGGTILGLYSDALKTITARSTQTGEFSTTMHEIGHHLQQRLNMDSTVQMQNTYGETNEESFAEFVATYMFDRNAAIQAAGQDFVDNFERKMRDNGCYRDVAAAATQVREWAAADAWETIGADITTHEESAANARRNTKRQWGRRFLTWLSAPHAAKAIDNAASHKGAQYRNGERVASLEESYQYSQHIPKIANTILTRKMTDMYGRTIDSRSLASILSDHDINDSNYHQMETYMFAMHALDRAKAGKPVWTDALKSPQAAREVMETAPENIKAAAEEFYNWWDKFARTWMVDTGLISEDNYKDWKKKYPHYVPMYADLSDFAEDFELGTNFAGTGTGDEWRFHEAHASSAPRITFFESVPDLVASVVRRAANNSVAQTLYYQLENDTNGDLRDFARISTVHQAVQGGAVSIESPTNARNAVEVMLPGGRRETIEVTDGLLLDVLQSAGSHGGLSPLLRTFKGVVRGMSELTTSRDPVFAVRNAIRDAQKAIPYGKTIDASLKNLKALKGTTSFTAIDHLVSYLKGAGEYALTNADSIAYNNPTMELYQDMGGGGEIYVGSSSAQAARKLKRELIQGYGNGQAREAASRVIDAATFQGMAEVSEQATRSLQFERSYNHYKELFGDTPYARIRAFLDSQQVTTDFAQGGYTEGYRKLRAIIPFMNPTMQGSYQTLEMIRNAFGGKGVTEEQASLARVRLAHTLVHYGLKAAAQLAVVHLLLDDDEKKDYNLIAEDIRRSNLILPAKLLGGKEREFIRLPIGQGGVDALLYGALLKGAASAETAMDLSFQKVITSAVGDMLPVDVAAGITYDGQGRATFNLGDAGVGITNSTVFGPLAGIAFNRNYYGGTIVPDYMIEQNVPIAQRAYNSTPEAFRAMSRALNSVGIEMAPLQLQYLTEQYGGVVGKYVLPLMSRDTATGEWSPAYAWNKTWRVPRNSFTIEPAYSNDTVDRFERNAGVLKSITTAYDNDSPLPSVVPSADREEVKTLVDELQAQYKEANKEVTALNKEMKSIRADTTIDYGTKQAMLRDLTMEQVRYEAAWNELYDAFMMQYGYGSLAWNVAMGRYGNQ